MKTKKKGFNKKTILTPSGLFATPKDMKGLMEYCSRFSGSESIVAFTVAGMTWNLAAKIVNRVKS